MEQSHDTQNQESVFVPEAIEAADDYMRDMTNILSDDSLSDVQKDAQGEAAAIRYLDRTARLSKEAEAVAWLAVLLRNK